MKYAPADLREEADNYVDGPQCPVVVDMLRWAADVIEAATKMQSCEASACMRSEALGETGMRDRFTALRGALAGLDDNALSQID